MQFARRCTVHGSTTLQKWQAAGGAGNIVYITWHAIFPLKINWVLFSLSGTHSTEIAVIREVYDGENAQERFELELERALEAAVPVIVIEPVRLGDETARWISVGNCLHKTAVLAGLGSIITGSLQILC